MRRGSLNLNLLFAYKKYLQKIQLQEICDFNSNRIIMKLGIAFKHTTVLVCLLASAMLLAQINCSNGIYCNSDGSLEIEGMYGIDLQRDDLIEINLLDKLPSIRAKLNGIALSNIYKGQFKTESLERVRLVINNKQLPYIEFITSDNKKVYHSADSEKSRELFDELKREFPELIRDYRGR